MSREAERLIGASLSGGRYQVGSLLGEGGMGLVFKAVDGNLDAEVVIKIPRRHMLDDPEFAERFAHEVRALVQLSDPHIVKVSDVGEHDGLPFAVMQYLAGGSLEDRHGLGDGGRVIMGEPSGLAAWLPSVGAALDFAHQRGYIHRDVKPANILFDARGNAYLGDFGVAKLIAAAGDGGGRRAMTGTGMVLGTAGYMAPEVILGESPDGRIDQYALGVTAFEVLSGRLPFIGPSPTAVLVMQSTQDAPSLAAARPGLPAALCKAIDRSLARDPKDRYPDCASMAKAVLDAASGVAPATAPPSAEARLRLDCPTCSSPLGLTPSMAGKRFRCPSCKTKLRVADDVRSLAVVPEGDGSTMELPVPGRTGSGSGPIEVLTPDLPRPDSFEPRPEPTAPTGRRRMLVPGIAASVALVVSALGIAAWARRPPAGSAVVPSTANAPTAVASSSTVAPAPRGPQASRLPSSKPSDVDPRDRVAEAERTYARVKESISNHRFVYARTLLGEYLDSADPPHRPEAQALIGWIDLATSEERARLDLADLDDDELSAYAAGGRWPRAEPIGSLPLQAAHLATLRRVVPSIYMERQRLKTLSKGVPARAPSSSPKARPAAPARAKFADVAADPSAFDGRDVLLDEVFHVAPKISHIGGQAVIPVKYYQGKTLADGVTLGRDEPLLLVDRDVANHYGQTLAKHGVAQNIKDYYKAILMVNIRQVDLSSGRRWAAVIVYMQILTSVDAQSLARGNPGQSFHAIEITRDDAYALFGRADEWIKRLGGEGYVSSVKGHLKRQAITARTNADRAALQRDTNAMMADTMKMSQRYNANELSKRRSFFPGSY